MRQKSLNVMLNWQSTSWQQLPELPRWAANIKITGALRLVVAAVVTTTAVVTNDVKPLNGCRTLSLQQPEFPQWLYNTNEISRYHVISCYCCCCCCWDTGVEGLTLSGATLIPIHWSLWTKKDKCCLESGKASSHKKNCLRNPEKPWQSKRTGMVPTWASQPAYSK